MTDVNEGTIEVADAPEAADIDAPAADPTPDVEFDATKALEKIRKANAEAANLRKRAKDAEAKAANAEELAARLPDLEAELVRERVGRRLSLPDALVERLRGVTEDDVMADAERLVSLIAPAAKSPVSRPVESLQTGTGKAASGTPTQLTRTDLRGMAPDAIEQARVEGRLVDVLSGKT